MTRKPLHFRTQPNNADFSPHLICLNFKDIFLGGIANLAPKLSHQAQIGPGTIKTSKLTPELRFTTQSNQIVKITPP
jgi:hypothetical protein